MARMTEIAVNLADHALMSEGVSGIKEDAARSSRRTASLLSERRDDFPRAVDPHGRPQDRQIKAGVAVFG